MRKPTDLLFLSYSLTSSGHYFLLDAVVSDFVSSLYIQTLAKRDKEIGKEINFFKFSILIFSIVVSV